MSGIPGVFNRDGRPGDLTIVGRMMAAAPHRGSNGARCWASGPIVVGHQQMGSLPEDVAQPVVDDSREIVVSMDGRLDNRADLLARLVPAEHPMRTPSDAELVLAAYERWGEDCAEQLLGDFAIAIWDGPRRRVFCARDCMGVRPFYYHVGDRVFVWGSDLRQILTSGAVGTLVPNEGMVAEYLARSIQSQDETLYRGIMRLPAAHTMLVTATDVRVRCYWRIDPARNVRCADDREYAEQFASLFQEAVRCRLRNGAGRTAAYLSGGLDSSSVVCTSHALGRPVETFSLVYPDDPIADECAYIDAVANRWNVQAHKIVAPPIDGAACRAHVGRRADTLDLPADVQGECLMPRMRERDVSVVLTGVGGDYCFGGSLLHYADLLRSGNVFGFIRQAWADRDVEDAGWSMWQPFVSGIRLLIPASARRAVRPLAKRCGMLPQLPDWIDPALVARVGLDERLRAPEWPRQAPTFSRGSVCDLFASGWPYLLLENADRAAAEYGIEERHPFFDRRLIEFGVAIPETQRWSGRQTKYVMREAMRGVLPDEVRERNGKADFRATVAQAVEAIGGEQLFDSLKDIASMGWIDERRVSALYRDSRRMHAANDEQYCDGMFKLWMIGGIELWYRMNFVERSNHVRPEPSVRPAAYAESVVGGERPAAPAVSPSGAH